MFVTLEIVYRLHIAIACVMYLCHQCVSITGGVGEFIFIGPNVFSISLAFDVVLCQNV